MAASTSSTTLTDGDYELLAGEFKLQIFCASFLAITTSLLLKPLGIPRVITQIMAGIILGPSVLGHIPGIRTTLFPCKGFSAYLEVYSTVGIMFHMFLVSIQMKPSMVLKPGKQGIVTGISMLVVPSIVSLLLAFIISKIAGVTLTETKALEFIGLFEATSSFSVVSYYLHELKIINSNFSRVAYSAALVNNILSIIMVMLLQIVVLAKNKGSSGVVHRFSTYTVLVIMVVFILKPLNKWMDRQIVEGQPLRQTHLSVVIALAMALAYYCIKSGLNPLYGPLIYGLTIPSDSRMGLSLLRRLEPFNTWLVMPVFYTMCGSEVDVFSSKSKKDVLIVLVVLSSYGAKILGAFLPAQFYNMSFTDSILLGLAVNAQGFFELFMSTMLYHRKLIDQDAYTIIIMSIVILTGVSTPIVRKLYKSTLENEGSSINTIQHAQPHDHFRVVACIYNEESVVSLIHLLKASSPTKYSPVNVCVVHLVNSVGISIPVFINHKLAKDHAHHVPASSHRIMNTFIMHAENDPGTMFVHPYTLVTPYATMHTDVYKLALQKRPYLIIIPFHKELSTGEVNASLRTVNCKILEDAPSSVGILIDRGLLAGTAFDPESLFSCTIAVVFLGGADDREALAYAARMSQYKNNELTVIRFLKSSSRHIQTKESIRDTEMVAEFNLRTANNPRVAYIEEEVNDGVGVIGVIKAMENNFDLILLGRQHDASTPLILDLTEWDCSELGTMGDIFINSNYGGKATILVVQQQRRAAARIARDKDIQLDSGNYTKLKHELL